MQFIKKLIPKFLLQFIRPYYHGTLALLANYYFDEPSKNMVVIGITGTAGKSTTVQMLARILNYDNKKCGFTQPHFSSDNNDALSELTTGTKKYNHQEATKSGAGFITTVSFFDGQTEFINKHGLSMPGGWLLHRQLKMMLDKGCKYAIVECTSEGLAQNRHLGIDFDYALFTNLSPAHVEAHGGFENYKNAKAKLFKAIGTSQTGVAKKTIGVNLDDAYGKYFLGFPAEKKFGVSLQITSPDLSFEEERNVGKLSPLSKGELEGVGVYQAHITNLGFELDGQNFVVKLTGEFNKYNALLAVAAANSLGISLANCSGALNGFKVMPGRMEPVSNNRGVQIFVDYGCEPASFEAALRAANGLPHKRLIHVFGSTGGHRDVQKRAIFGQTSAEFADYIIITNDDVYDSDPERIASDIEAGIVSSKSYILNPIPYKKILDRRAAIHHALEIAKAEDLVLITGKGSEQFLVLPGNKRIEWDDVGAVKQELSKL